MLSLRRWMRCGVVAIGLLAGGTVALAAPRAAAAKAEKPAKSPLSGKWAAMATAAKLTPEQQSALAAKVKAMDEALKQFDESKAAQLKAAKEQTETIAKERKELSDKLNADAMTQFTPEQIQAMQAEELMNKAAGKYKSVLTDDQKAKALQLSADAAKSLAAIKGEDKEAAAKRAEITKKLDADIAALLTPEQKATITATEVQREAIKNAKGVKMTPAVQQATAGAAQEAAKKLADLAQQRQQVLDELKAKIEAEAAKTPPPAPKKAPKAKPAAPPAP